MVTGAFIGMEGFDAACGGTILRHVIGSNDHTGDPPTERQACEVPDGEASMRKTTYPSRMLMGEDYD